jgi:hypothetical protein
MAEDFLRHSRKTHRVLWSLHPRRSTAILPSPLAETCRALAASEGPFDLWGEGFWHQGWIGEPSQTLTSVRLTDGDGAAGLPDRDRLWACILPAIPGQHATRASPSSKDVRSGETMEQRPKKLLDHVRDAIRLKHYSRHTEHAYVTWIKRYIFFHDKGHPKEMGAADIEAFLTHLAVRQKVAASTNPALARIRLQALAMLTRCPLPSRPGNTKGLWCRRGNVRRIAIIGCGKGR